MEINPVVVETYSHNFPRVKVSRRNIESLTAEEINLLNVDAIIMSPPCQPFCRMGLGQGSKDSRSTPLNHILSILPSIKFKYIFVENVQGFETSDAHQDLIQTLLKCNFKFQEFMLSPTSVGIPNSRLRYYLIGKLGSLPWSSEVEPKSLIKSCLPNKVPKSLVKLMDTETATWKSYRLNRKEDFNYGTVPFDYPRSICDVLEPFDQTGQFLVPPTTAQKYWNALDIVNVTSTQSCCFTKAYFHYLTGTGSILDCTFPFEKLIREDGSLSCKIEERKLRYFTPREVARLMCYPEQFDFPSHHTSKQRYKALGNSVNVYVVSILMCLLFDESDLSDSISSN